MAGLRKLRNKYYIRIWIDGKEKLLPTGTTVKADAEKQLRRVKREEVEIKQRIRKEIYKLQNRLTIHDGIEYFINNVGKERNLQKTTIYTYNLAMNDFKNCFKGIEYFELLNKKHYSELLDYLQCRYNPTTINIRLRSIRVMLNFLFEKEMINKLPFRVKQIRVDQGLPKFILPDEMNRIYKAVNNKRLLSIFRVYEVTGMRLGELKHCRIEDEFIIIEKSKNRKERIIPIPIENIPDYETAKKCNISDSRISHIFSDICRQVGLKGKTLHCLRHTFALRKLLETNNISLVKELGIIDKKWLLFGQDFIDKSDFSFSFQATMIL